jgi:hypothetical protein
MPDNIYRVLLQQDGLFAVEITLPNGKQRLIPDFRDESEAEAWIIQIRRARRSADPTLPIQYRLRNSAGKHT